MFCRSLVQAITSQLVENCFLYQREVSNFRKFIFSLFVLGHVYLVNLFTPVVLSCHFCQQVERMCYLADVNSTGVFNELAKLKYLYFRLAITVI